MKKIMVILFVFSSLLLPTLSYGLDVACPKEMPKIVDLDGVEIEYNQLEDFQVSANIYFASKYKNLELYDVSIRQGDWELSSDGDILSAPSFSASLKIKTHKGKPFVQVLIGERERKLTLSIQYGEVCEYKMYAELKTLKDF